MHVLNGVTAAMLCFLVIMVGHIAAVWQMARAVSLEFGCSLTL
jgi:hypothetical protein